MAIRFFDMFAGIGGFRSGLEAAGGFECIEYCEIDPYTRKAYETLYDTKGEVSYEDARTIRPEDLPDVDLICGGFPCQTFSIAGKRAAFGDPRGTLFFEIARIAAAKRPRYLLLENVPGLLSSDKGRTFAAILNALDELWYHVAWQVLNSKDFGVPQSRNRVYVIGYLGEDRPGEIPSFSQTNGAALEELVPHKEGRRIYSDSGVSITLTGNAGGFGGRTGLYNVSLPIKVKTKSGFQLAHPGDSIDLAYPNQNSRRGRVGEQIAHTITASPSQGVFFIDYNEDPEVTEIARCVTARQDSGMSKHKRERSAVFSEEDSPFAMTFTDKKGQLHVGRVRRLMPIECWRLQGFTDEQFGKVKALGMSDSRLYRMAGECCDRAGHYGAGQNDLRSRKRRWYSDMTSVLIFIAGMFIGALLGVTITALCVAASRADDGIERDK